MAEPRARSSRIEVRQVPLRHAATVRETVAQDDVTEAIGRMFQTVGAAIAKQGMEPDSAPFARYHDYGESIDLEAEHDRARDNRP